MRGDRPPGGLGYFVDQQFTPHARGSTLHFPRIVVLNPVYPACAGIDPRLIRHNLQSQCLPRMRGDRPYAQQLRDEKAQFTPHARGSTVNLRLVCLRDGVYPACAGIDPGTDPSYRPRLCLPRMRGDRPQAADEVRMAEEFTPHARGSTVIVVM